MERGEGTEGGRKKQARTVLAASSLYNSRDSIHTLPKRGPGARKQDVNYTPQNPATWPLWYTAHLGAQCTCTELLP